MLFIIRGRKLKFCYELYIRFWLKMFIWEAVGGSITHAYVRMNSQFAGNELPRSADNLRPGPYRIREVPVAVNGQYAIIKIIDIFYGPIYFLLSHVEHYTKDIWRQICLLYFCVCILLFASCMSKSFDLFNPISNIVIK